MFLLLDVNINTHYDETKDTSLQHTKKRTLNSQTFDFLALHSLSIYIMELCLLFCVDYLDLNKIKLKLKKRISKYVK